MLSINFPIEYNSYYLTSPFVFKKKREIITSIPEEYTILKTIKTAICASDLHYFLGNKSKEKLRTRLPLILLHEGVCMDLRTGINVVPIPGDFNSVSIDYLGKENLSPGLKYMGATAPGMAREFFIYPQNLIVPISPTIDYSVASLTEPLSIVLKAIKDLDIQIFNKVAIIGDGEIAFLLALMINTYLNLPKENITVYGVDEIRLQKFSKMAKIVDITSNLKIIDSEIIIEAVGGKNIQSTLDLAFSLARPGSIIGVIGISDESPKININKLVNSAISIKGFTRSTYIEFEYITEFLKNKEISDRIKEFIDPKEFKIKNEKDITDAFEYANKKRKSGRVILDWS